jgi:hypothetical protein
VIPLAQGLFVVGCVAAVLIVGIWRSLSRPDRSTQPCGAPTRTRANRPRPRTDAPRNHPRGDPTCPGLVLTPARRRGLAVLLAAHQRGQTAYESNTTSTPDAGPLTIYWQTARWLTQQSYATTVLPDGQGCPVAPTDKGLRLARLANGEVAP